MRQVNDELANRIRRARAEAGLSREHLAGKIGVSLATVAATNQGRTQEFRSTMLNNIAMATGKPLVWFLEEAA